MSDWAALETFLSDNVEALKSSGISVQSSASIPKPLFVVSCPATISTSELGSILEDLAEALLAKKVRLGKLLHCRCTDLERLPCVLETGIDVQPSDAVIWTTWHADKALEYGGREKVMLILDADSLRDSWVDIESSTPRAEIERLKETFPTEIPSVDGERLWLTRLLFEDRRAAMPYEAEYGHWIPGDPREALQAVFVIGNDMPRLTEWVRTCVANCQAVKWT